MLPGQCGLHDNFPTGTFTYACHDSSGPGGSNVVFFSHPVTITDPEPGKLAGRVLLRQRPLRRLRRNQRRPVELRRLQVMARRDAWSLRDLSSLAAGNSMPTQSGSETPVSTVASETPVSTVASETPVSTVASETPGSTVWDWRTPFTLLTVREHGSGNDPFFPGFTETGELALEDGERVIDKVTGVSVIGQHVLTDGSVAGRDWLLREATVWITSSRLVWAAKPPRTSNVKGIGAPISAAMANAFLRAKHSLSTRGTVMCGHARWIWPRNISVGSPVSDAVTLHMSLVPRRNWVHVHGLDADRLQEFALRIQETAVAYHKELPWLSGWPKFEAHLRDTPLALKDDGYFQPTLTGWRGLGVLSSRPPEGEADPDEDASISAMIHATVGGPIGIPGMRRLRADGVPKERLLAMVDEAAAARKTVKFSLRGGGAISAVKTRVTERRPSGAAITFSALDGKELGVASAVCMSDTSVLVYMQDALGSRELVAMLPLTPQVVACQQHYDDFLDDLAERVRAVNRDADVRVENLW
jgi:hypothetical protein